MDPARQSDNSLGAELIPSVYWYRPGNSFNLGDEITTILLRHLFQVPHEHHLKVDDADIVSVGSNLNQVYGRAEMRLRTLPLAVLGSGFMHPFLRVAELPYITTYSLRGHLSASLLPKQEPGISLGDPGLLMSDLEFSRPSPKRTFGFIPHVSQIGNAKLLNWVGHLGDVRIIDYRTSDYAAVLSSMSECEIILSQSLHGLILADSLGIPNSWVNSGDLHMGGCFKFFDYFSSVGRDFNLSVVPDYDLSEQRVISSVHQLNDARLRNLKDDIRASFFRLFNDLDMNK